MRLPRLTPTAYRRVTLAALFSLAFIIVTGAAVRLTGSGLGCPDWPTCDENRLVAPLEYHAMVEFVNRTVTGFVSLAVIIAVLGALVRVPRRRDLTWLSLGLVAGVIGQIVLGGLTVLFHLAPPLVMGHFLLSMVLLLNAVVLHHRAGEPDDGGPPQPVVTDAARTLARLAWMAAAIVVFTGTIVTAAGPHGGDEDVERLDVFLPDAARVHGISVIVLLALTSACLWLLRRENAPAPVMRRGLVLLGVLLAQGAVGYIQYFNGVPVLLVAVHIVGAVAVWTAAIRFNLGLFVRGGAAGRAVPMPAREPALV